MLGSPKVHTLRPWASQQNPPHKEWIMKRLEGKVAVVTGGNSGIGLATAKRFKEEGARVAIAGRDPGTLKEAVRSLGNDILFVNAGIAKFAPLAATSESLYDEIFDINTKGAYFTIQKALPFLNDGASIVL